MRILHPQHEDTYTRVFQTEPYMCYKDKKFSLGKKIYEKDQPGAQKYWNQDDFASWFAQDSLVFARLVPVLLTTSLLILLVSLFR